jgi:hypothetical protein
MVKCCGFVEFQHELGKKMQKQWKFAKNLVQNVEFLSSGDFPSLMNVVNPDPEQEGEISDPVIEDKTVKMDAGGSYAQYFSSC